MPDAAVPPPPGASPRAPATAPPPPPGAEASAATTAPLPAWRGDGDDAIFVPGATLPERVAGDGEVPPAAGEVLLSVQDLRAGYGEVPVLHGLSFTVNVGETAVLLGLNGAGKTTTAAVLCGRVKPSGGSVAFRGSEIGGWGTQRCVREGIVMVPEGRRVFPQLSVRQNLDVGAWTRRREAGWLEEQRARVYGYFPRLAERADQAAGTLSGGEQQMLAIGRGLMARPRLLVIDEASLGLAPVVVKDVFAIVRQINADGVTVILVEQNVGALEVATLGLVMEQGRIVSEVRGEELRNPDAVRKAFLG